MDSDDENNRSGDRVDDEPEETGDDGVPDEDAYDDSDRMSMASEASSAATKAILDLSSNLQNNMQMMEQNHEQKMEEMRGMFTTTTTITTNLAAMFATMPTPIPRARRGPRTAVNGVVPDSPQKIAFLLDHDNVVNKTNHITPLLNTLTIKELWWVQQHVDEEKIKYDMKSRLLSNYKEDVWKYQCKQKADMTVGARNPPRT